MKERVLGDMTRYAKGAPRVSISGRRLACFSLLALLAVLVFGVSAAGALGPTPEAENFIPRFGEYGSGAGETALPVGVGTNPVTGDVYISDWGNQRINEFTAWGVFVRAFGWGVADGASKELQTCTTTCFPGLEGSGAGEFHTPWGIVVDQGGDVYVRDYYNRRVEKFTSSGQFLLMFGGEVDKTEVHKREAQEAKSEPVTVTAEEEDVCTAVSGDECGTGVEGPGPGQFDQGFDLALGLDGTVFVADSERIEGFEPDGVYKSEVKIPGKTVRNLAVDRKNGNFYLTYEIVASGRLEENVYRLSPAGTPLGTIEVKEPSALATDQSGNVYVLKGSSSFTEPQSIVEFDSSGRKLVEFGKTEAGRSAFNISGLGTNTIGDLYVTVPAPAIPSAFVSAYGPAPVGFEPPPSVAPTINSEYVVSSDLDSAVVEAQINPRFWSDTSYYVQYGTEDCALSACVSQPVAPGSTLTGRVVAEPIATQGVQLSGLQPGTTYHYRFVAVSGGGGPVFGPDRTFRTFAVPAADTDCPNQAFRTGFSAVLPDCRAYEMVSPVDKEGADIVTLPENPGYHNGLFQSAVDGKKFAYSSYRAFGDAKGAPYTNQYIAGRDPVSGWSSEPVSPPQRAEPEFTDLAVETDFKLFSSDLSSGWLVPSRESALALGAVQGIRTIYRRDSGTGAFEALMTVTPPNVSASEFSPELQGVSADGTHTVFRANDMLTPDASSEKGDGGFGDKEIAQVYESYDGGALRLVSILPDGVATTRDSSAGYLGSSLNNFQGAHDRSSSVSHAVSGDGSRVYWSETNGFGAPGRLYLRENADREQSAISGGECVEPALACTVAVSSKASEFWVASVDGSRALYTIAEGARQGELDEFSVEEGTSTPVAEKVVGVVGASEDLAYVYFVSSEALTPDAQSGRPNFYVRHGGASTLIAILSSADTDSKNNYASDVNSAPVGHAVRVTPDGRRVAFISTAALTGYDNTDLVTGKPDSEVYIYDAETHNVVCVSCDPSGARPSGREARTLGSGPFLATAATIPPWENELYASRALSDDGTRLFFDSYDALTPRDTNGREDVYEWEAAGTGDCGAQSAAFSSADGGCVSLISSGESPGDSEFVDATPDGGDVFVATEASLLPQDPGLVDIYDARVDGGFPAPSGSVVSCEGEACQGAPAPPEDRTPASAAFDGPSDLVSPLPGAVAPKSAGVNARAVALAKALRVCRGRARARRRKSCERTARKRYGPGAKRSAGKSNVGRGR